MSRRKFMKALTCAGICSGLNYAHVLEPYWLRVVHHRLSLSGAQEKQVRIVHLSDLHYSRHLPISFIKKAFHLALAEQPDLICLTGDYVDNFVPDKSAYIQAFRKLSETAPCYATLGNHDGPNLYGYSSSQPIRRILADGGIQCLHNRAVKLQIRGAELVLVGVGDSWVREMKPEKAFHFSPEWKLLPSVLLSHNPDTKDDLRRYPWQLMLSGHTHGGQIRIPLLDAAPLNVIGDTRYLSGLNPWGKRFIHTTPGIASAMRVRFNCRPEVSVLNLFV